MTEPAGGIRRRRRRRPSIGWREWVALPDFGDAVLKAKIDTGARTSALHAFDLTEIERNGQTWVQFTIHPLQRDTTQAIPAAARLIGRRAVRHSGGQSELRPVISTTVAVAGRRWEIELTLTRRDEMGFRMLLGRSAIRRRFLVDPGRSFLVSEVPGPQ